MKHFLMVGALAVVVAGVVSCKKNGSTAPAGPLAGKWTIVDDSVSTPGLSDGVDYIGTAADYYDFRDNGTLDIREGTASYTTIYGLVNDDQGDQVDIVYTLSNGYPVHRLYAFTDLTAHTLTLTLVGISLGPAQKQIIHLRK
jgi:hypothetical protein